MRKSGRLIALWICSCLSFAGPALADAVVDWNAYAAQAIGTALASGRPGPATLLDFATVHIAVYDAVQAIDRRYQPYHAVIPDAAGSMEAAAAKAALDVLVNRFPSQAASLTTTWHTWMASKGISETDPGVDVGAEAAAEIIAFRSNDGSFPTVPPAPFVGGNEPGQWRPTPSFLAGPPPSGAPMAATWLATVTPFTIKRPSHFRAPAPPPLTSEIYTRDYNEVKDYGSFSSTLRTPEQKDLAYFWATDFGGSWNRTLREIATSDIDHIGDSARLFALANVSAADAAITAWDSKIAHAFWRPVTAIREDDGNRRTDPDPSWQPLINTPNYPDYTSGANNVTGAVTKSIELFFGTDQVNFSVTTTNALAIIKTRTYTRCSDAAQEVVDARIFEGIHFRFADEEARRQGRRVAKYAFHHYLQPIGGHGAAVANEEGE